MRVFSLNIWNLNEPLAQRMDKLADGLEVLAPDLLCLQEVSTLAGKPQVAGLLARLGFEFLYCPTGSWYGREEGLVLGWKSRYELRDSIFLKLPHREPDMRRGAIVAWLRIENRDIIACTTHLAYRIEDRDLRRVQVREVVRRMCERLGSWAGAPIVCGDLNDEPESGISEELVQALGLYDAQAAFGWGDAETFDGRNPFVDPALGPNRRIDYILPSCDLPLRDFYLVFCRREELASDHYGLVAEIGA